MYRGRLPSLSAVVALCRLRWPPTKPGAHPPCLRVPRRTTATTRVAAVAASAPPQCWGVWCGGRPRAQRVKEHASTDVGGQQKVRGRRMGLLPPCRTLGADRGRQLGARAQWGAVENKAHRQLASEGPARGTRRPGATATTGTAEGAVGSKTPRQPVDEAPIPGLVARRT